MTGPGRWADNDNMKSTSVPFLALPLIAFAVFVCASAQSWPTALILGLASVFLAAYCSKLRNSSSRPQRLLVLALLTLASFVVMRSNSGVQAVMLPFFALIAFATSRFRMIEREPGGDMDSLDVAADAWERGDLSEELERLSNLAKKSQ